MLRDMLIATAVVFIIGVIVGAYAFVLWQERHRRSRRKVLTVVNGVALPEPSDPRWESVKLKNGRTALSLGDLIIVGETKEGATRGTFVRAGSRDYCHAAIYVQARSAMYPDTAEIIVIAYGAEAVDYVHAVRTAVAQRTVRASMVTEPEDSDKDDSPRLLS